MTSMCFFFAKLRFVCLTKSAGRVKKTSSVQGTREGGSRESRDEKEDKKRESLGKRIVMNSASLNFGTANY